MILPFEMQELDVTLVAGGMTLRVLEVTIAEGMSKLTEVKAIVASPTDLDFEQALDEDAMLTITNGGIPIRTFALRLGKAQFAGFVEQTIRYELTFHPTFYFTGFRRDTAKFRDMTTEAIIDMVLDEDGVEHEWGTTRKCDSRPYTVQYRETDLDFVRRLLEFEGIYYTFDDMGVMQLGDASGSLPEVPGTFELLETSKAGVHDRAGVTELGRGAVFNSGAAAVNDYNWKNPYNSLLATAKSELDAEFETYEYPVGYRENAQGELLAKLRMQALVAQKKFVEGASSVVDFRAGKIFNFMHDEAYDFSGRYLLVEVTHTIATRDAKTKHAKYSNQFRAIPADTPFRPPVVTPRPVIIGNHTAMVRGPEGEEIHTDEHGRAKVQFHWDRDANGLDDSRWIRTVQETSTSIVLSRVGWEVSVGYVDGDPDRPMGMGRQINGQMVPEYDQPKFKNRMSIKTETYPGKRGFNELRMDDSAGSQFMDFHSQNDFYDTTDNNKTETIGNDYNQLVKEGHHRTVDKNQDVTIKGNEKRQVGEDFSEKVDKDRKENVGGNERLDAQKAHALSVAGNDTEEVRGDRSVLAGEASPQAPDGPDLIDSLITSTPDGFTDAKKDAAPDLVMGPPAPAPKAAETDGFSEAPSAEGGDGGGGEGGEGEGEGGGVVIQRRVDKDFKKTIKGSYMKLADAQINHQVGDLIQEEVEGTKHTTSEEASIHQANGGKMVRKVGGNVVRKAKGKVTTASKESLIKVDGNMSVTSNEMVEVRSDEIDIVADSKLTFESSGLIIEMTPDTIKVSGDIKLASSATIDFKASRDKMTGG